MPGELYIGGDGLARGYLNRPELTAEKFIPNPFSDEPDARLYKTGDKVRYLPDGNIEFLGRLDQQVKLRGYRIELGEIEAALMQHAAIHNAVVVLREDSPGHKRLAAYVTAEADLPDTCELRAFLKQHLPDYMLPSAFVALKQFPLTPNGKVDRNALPAPEQSELEHIGDYVAPRSPVEEILAGLWAEVLNLKRVGIHDNFFEQGGDSLLAVQLVARVEELFNKRIPIEEVFKHPTVIGQALFLNKYIAKKSNYFEKLITPIRIQGQQQPLFWLFGGKVVPLIYKNLKADQPFYFLNHQTMSDGKPAKHTDIFGMGSLYLDIIQKIKPDGPYLLGGYSAGGLIAFEVARRLREQGKHVELLFLLSPSPPGKSSTSSNISSYGLKLQYRQLNIRGTFSFLLRLFRKFPSQGWRYIKRLVLKVYLIPGKKIPLWLRSNYITNIYLRAFPMYHVDSPLKSVNKTVLVYERNWETQQLYLKQWESLIDGEIDTYAFDKDHLDLIEYNGAMDWIKILTREIDAQNEKRVTS